MKIFYILLILLITQSTCFAYVSYNPSFINQRLFRRGVMTGIPTPIVQYNIPPAPQPYYVNRKHIKKKYRKYYPSSQESSFTIIEN